MQVVWGALEEKCFICQVVYDAMFTPGSGFEGIGFQLKRSMEENEDPLVFELGFAADISTRPQVGGVYGE
jgi:hypothetical protein